MLSSHQRQLSLQLSQVQERLIKNKTLLTAAEPAITCTSLEVSYRSEGIRHQFDFDLGSDWNFAKAN